MTELAHYVPPASTGESWAQWDPYAARTIRLPVAWRDVAPVVGSLGLIAGTALAGYAWTDGPVGLVGGGVGAFAAVIAGHKVAWVLGRYRPGPVARPVPMLPGPVDSVPVTVEVVAVEGPVSEPWPGVHVEGAPRFA